MDAGTMIDRRLFETRPRNERKVETGMRACLLVAMSGKRIIHMSNDKEGRTRNFTRFREIIQLVQTELKVELEYRIKGVDFHFKGGGLVAFRHAEERVQMSEISQVWKDEDK